MILVLDFLKLIHTKIDLDSGSINFDNGEERIEFKKCKDVNYINIIDEDVLKNIKSQFAQIIKNNSNVSADPKEALPYNTNIIATIRTKTDDPIYSKSHPYPMGVSDFVNEEIKNL